MLKKIKEAYIEYIREGYSSRNQKSINVLHNAVKDKLLQIISKIDDLEIRSISNGGEYKFESEIHDKKIDITVVDKNYKKEKYSNGYPVIAISCKMPLKSINKNLKNYFEMNIGDTTLVKQSGTPFYYIMVLDKNSIKEQNKKILLEEISPKSMEVFSKIMKSPVSASYRPNHSFIAKVNFNDKNYKKEFIGKTKKEYINSINYHIDFIKNKEVSAEIYNENGNWTSDFNDKLDLLFEMINLDVKIHEIRKKLNF